MYLIFYVESLARVKNVEHVASKFFLNYFWVVVVVIVTAAVGIPIRLYLISGATFRPPGLRNNFLKLFPMIFPARRILGPLPVPAHRQTRLRPSARRHRRPALLPLRPALARPDGHQIA